MATNKNAVLRYNVLDKCLRNNGRKYSIEDLLEAVNEALVENDPNSTGIKIRQLREDIRFMKSEAGYAAPIEAILEEKKGFYRYEDTKFSINKSPLNETEAEQLKNAIAILQRFEGSPEFEWVNEIAPMLNDKFGLVKKDKKVMGYDSNIDYSGYEYIATMFNAIVNKRVLNITYKPFEKNAFTVLFHPYYLKQYNNRWFVFGHNQELKISTWNIALDRIISINELNKKYLETSIDWEEYLYDIIGVTKPTEKIQDIELLFSKQQAPYIETKPLHPSQKSTLLEDGRLRVRLKLIPNFELEMQLLSFGEKVEVVSPKALRQAITKRLKIAAKQY